jgi:hypothetical protein
MMARIGAKSDQPLVDTTAVGSNKFKNTSREFDWGVIDW